MTSFCNSFVLLGRDVSFDWRQITTSASHLAINKASQDVLAESNVSRKMYDESSHTVLGGFAFKL